MLLAALLALSCAGPADSGDTDGDPCAGQPGVTWDNFGDGFFAGYCRSCHSAGSQDRYGAPEGIDFDTLEQVAEQAELIRSAVLERGTMPKGGGLLEEDATLLAVFLDCGLPL